jgi:membrane-bound metal-dependent hydrolase YbcI (DUF457 family)
LLGKITSKTIGTKINLALLFTASVLPDFDLLLFRFIEHRGPLHSLFFCLIVSLPFLIFYKKKAIPYFVALLSHSLIGDIFSGGIQLLWPISTERIFVSSLQVRSSASLGMELILFVVSIVVMIAVKDFQKLLQSKTSLVYWMLPFGAVLAPLLLTFGHQNYLPLLLIPPSLFYLALFSNSMINSLRMIATNGLSSIFVRE